MCMGFPGRDIQEAFGYESEAQERGLSQGQVENWESSARRKKWPRSIQDKSNESQVSAVSVISLLLLWYNAAATSYISYTFLPTTCRIIGDAQNDAVTADLCRPHEKP